MIMTSIYIYRKGCSSKVRGMAADDGFDTFEVIDHLSHGLGREEATECIIIYRETNF